MTLGKVRFGILGCGVIGPHHARAIAGLEDAELVAVADVVPGLAEELAAEYGCSSHYGLGEMLSGAELDAVYTPPISVDPPRSAEIAPFDGRPAASL